RWIDGETNEDFRFASGQLTRRRKAGGEQQLVGVYAQDIFTLIPRLQVTIAGRLDYWRSFDASRVEQDKPGVPPTGIPVRDTPFPDRDELAFSPKVALLYHATDQLSLRGSFYQGFRAPTINELFRPFRVRNDITEANESLNPERLIGGEIGTDYSFAGNLLAKLTAFWNEVEDPVVNVTIGAGPGNIVPCGFVPAGGVCRQRQNLDRTRIRGIEAEVEYRPYAFLTLSGSYLFNETEVLSAPRQPELEGKRIAQVPRHQFALKLIYTNPALVNVSVQGRYVGDQFEDDINSLRLGDYFVVDLMLWRSIPVPKVSASELFLAVENLFDRTYEVGKTTDGIVTIGAPLLVHGGIRVRF
ncbi:MAG TPA: TonB-dependent receptor, partial [Candidatus Methylomirabilis sp.]|nr:TonB-dependent receptor [Candidatus Methylomirabilis sp.]